MVRYSPYSLSNPGGVTFWDHHYLKPVTDRTNWVGRLRLVTVANSVLLRRTLGGYSSRAKPTLRVT